MSPTVQLTAGPIEYADTGGDHPVVVLLHGVLMDGRMFDAAVEDLRADHRCVVPTLPLGSHDLPMRSDADLSLSGFGRLVAEFLEQLDLRAVTLVGNDHAAALVVAAHHPERVGRLVACSCEAFENYPPGLPGKNLGLAARLPGALFLGMQAMRFGPVRRSPLALGLMSKRGVPDELSGEWFMKPRRDPLVRRDLRRYAAGARRRQMLELMDSLRDFTQPALVLWGAEDRVMPPAHGRRLAELLPQGRLVEIPDSRTLVPVDQPARFAAEIRSFVAEARRTAAAS